MNYIVLANHFWAKRLEHSFSANDIAVYFALVDTCNQLHWKNPFNFSVAELQAKLRLSTKDPLDTARNRLKQAGLLDYKNGQGRGNTTQYFLFDPEAPTEKGGKKGQKNTTLSPSFLPPFSPPFSPAEKPTVLKTKPKPNQTRANALGASGQVEGEEGATFNDWRQWCATNLGQHGISQAPAHFCTFEIFWDAYGKKINPKKCSRKWDALPLTERQLALAKLPAYVASTPDKQFRKDPLTWLNNESWNDELVHRGGATSSAGQAARPAAPPPPLTVEEQRRRTEFL